MYEKMISNRWIVRCYKRKLLGCNVYPSCFLRSAVYCLLDPLSISRSFKKLYFRLTEIRKEFFNHAPHFSIRVHDRHRGNEHGIRCFDAQEIYFNVDGKNQYLESSSKYSCRCINGRFETRVMKPTAFYDSVPRVRDIGSHYGCYYRTSKLTSLLSKLGIKSRENTRSLGEYIDEGPRFANRCRSSYFRMF